MSLWLQVAFWLIENGLTVLIAACDTFRAGAVEQLRTHKTKLNTIHSGKRMVELYEKGYDKDAASVAMSAIAHGRYNLLYICLILYGLKILVIPVAGKLDAG